MIWIKSSNKLPEPHKEVMVAVRNKNKPDGIWVYDHIYHDGEEWVRDGGNTWEDIKYWCYINEPESEL